MARRRAQWTKYRNRIDPSRLVFIDETWTKTNMAPLRGWAPRGQRIKAKVPHGHWQTMTFLAALRHDRIDGPVAYRRADQRRMLPPLRRKGAHPDPATRRHRDHGQSRLPQEQRRASGHPGAGARLFFLPKYSPDLNPIEQFFSKLKHWLRKAAQRTTDDVCNAIGRILDTVTSDECANYFVNGV